MTKPRTPTLNFLVKSKNHNKPITKSHKYFFIMLHVVFALDFGFIKLKSPRNRILMKLITLSQSSAVFTYLSFVIFESDYLGSLAVWYFMDVLKHYIFCLTLIVSKTTFHDFQTDLHSFDAEIEVDSTYGVEYKLIIWFLLLLVYRLAMSYAYCVVYLEYCEIPIEIRVLYNMSCFGMDTVLIVYTCVFYAAYLRLKRFTSFVKSDGKDVTSCQYLYKCLVEIIERMKKIFDLVLIVTLVTNTMDITFTAYFNLVDETMQHDSVDTLITYAIVTEELLLLFSPAFTAGLVTSQAEKLKLVLYDKLIKDKTHSKDIKRFVGYIEGRPLRFKVWRVVPLDWRLPVVVINVAVTYLIVMIQFTHKH